MRYAILHGTVVGPIWQPGYVCSKNVTARIERGRTVTPRWPASNNNGAVYPSLRAAMQALTSDGDFQACGFVPDETWLEVFDEVQSIVRNGGISQTESTRRRVRAVMFACPQTADMRANPEWVADYEDNYLEET